MIAIAAYTHYTLKLGLFSSEEEVRKWIVEELVEKIPSIKSWYDNDTNIDICDISEIKNIIMTKYTLEQLVEYCSDKDLHITIERK